MECLLASIFDGFWWVSGAKLGRKIEPLSTKNRSKRASKNDEKKVRPGGFWGEAEAGDSGAEGQARNPGPPQRKSPKHKRQA